MRRLKLWLIVGVAVAALALPVSITSAAPLPGGTHRQFDFPITPELFFVSAPGCSVWAGTPAQAINRASNTLHTHVDEWVAPAPNQPPFVLEIVGTAEVRGTVTDTAGNTFQVAGQFDEDRLEAEPGILFSGPGHLTLAGPAGTIVGDGSLLAVVPGFTTLSFDSYSVCRSH